MNEDDIRAMSDDELRWREDAMFEAMGHMQAVLNEATARHKAVRLQWLLLQREKEHRANRAAAGK